MTLAAIAGLVLCVAGAVSLQIARDRLYADQSRETARILYVRSGEAVKRLALDFDALWADVYWIRAIQHYGGERLQSVGRRKYELLFPLLDLTTTLDPYFSIAYRFGAIFLSEASPGGPGRPDQAIALLRKGVAAQPGKWQYLHDIAFVYYWHFRDFDTAAMWFQRASELPNAPNWLKPLAASVLGAGSDRASARFLWNQILQSEEEWLRRNAARALSQLDAVDAVDQLQAIVNRFPPPAGGQYSWEALVRRRVLRGIPLDPVWHTRSISIPPPVESRSRGARDFPRCRSTCNSALMTDATLALIGLAILGLAVGSFLNVCIHRLPRGESIVQPGSRCPHCGYVLGWSDNVPVLSYLFLGGKCRKCRAGDLDALPDRRARDDGDLRHPRAGLWSRHHPGAAPGVRDCARRPVCDRSRTPSAAERHHPARHRRRPGLQRFASRGSPPGIVDSLIGILAGGGVLWLVGEAYYRYSGQEGMGGGDVKMLAMIGAFLGWKLMVLTLVLSSILGSVVGVIVIAVQAGGMKYALPYGTFLSLAALFSSLFGSRILDWYLGFYQ